MQPGPAVKKEAVVGASKKELGDGGSLSASEKEEVETKSQASEEDVSGLWNLLDETGKMLKGMQMGSALGNDRGVLRKQRLRELQRELDMLKGNKRLNTLRITKIETKDRGLFDSGATYLLRYRESTDNYASMDVVYVCLMGRKLR